MFALGAATRVYVATGITDMRIGFDGLYGKIRDVLECDPTSGHIFLFSNARRNRLKLVFFDGSGLWVCSKRMEGGRLYWPAPAGSEKREETEVLDVRPAEYLVRVIKREKRACRSCEEQGVRRLCRSASWPSRFCPTR
jgi:transposase